MPAMGKELNLMNLDVETTHGTVAQSIISYNGFDYRAGVINGTLFRRPESTDALGSGSGVFRDLYKNQAGGNGTTEQGYNRNGVMDAAVPGGFDPFIKVGDLLTDQTGLFYVFVVDVNDEKNAKRFISLDKFELIVEDNADGLGFGSDPASLPGTEASLGDLGTTVYNMDAGEDSTVFLDYSTSKGSGTFDLFVFIPKSNFAGMDSEAYVYLFTEFGTYADATTIDFGVGAGPEQVAAYNANFVNPNDPIPDIAVPASFVPEPSSALLASFGALFLMFKRRRG